MANTAIKAEQTLAKRPISAARKRSQHGQRAKACIPDNGNLKAETLERLFEQRNIVVRDWRAGRSR